MEMELSGWQTLALIIIFLFALHALGAWIFGVFCYWIGYISLRILTFGRHPRQVLTDDAQSTQRRSIELFGVLLFVLVVASPIAWELWAT